MSKKIKIAIILVAMITVAAGSLGFANDQQKLNDLNREIQKNQTSLKDSKAKDKTLANQIANLDKKIQESENSISGLESEIKKTKQNITKTQQELEAKNAEVTEQNDNLNARLRAMYKNGDVGYIEVLLGSGSFTELMNNVDMISRIYKQDESILDTLKTQYEKITETKKSLEAFQIQLISQQKQLTEKQKGLEVDRGQATALRADVKEDIKSLESMINSLNADAEAISAKIRAAQGNQDFVGGTFTNPAPDYTKISSTYGYRPHPILKTKKMHTGVDFASASGSRCVAANDGTVIMSGWNGGYGYAVVIDHGGGITTLYGHNSKLLVSVGDKVKRGQEIAKIGSTGQSTGPHCHFEVRINGKHTDPMPYLK